jgi:hypothetical protein
LLNNYKKIYKFEIFRIIFDLNSESDTISNIIDTETMLRVIENGIDDSGKC